MNPAHFQNMGAMGGGMPNPMQQQMRTNPNLTSQQIQRIILQNLNTHTQSLQAQGKLVGWHSTVQLEQRAAQVKLLIDSLRLIQPVVAYDQAINVALTFEAKAFSQEPTREKYFATIKEKLSRIQDTRASQVQNQSNNLQQMMQPGQNMAFNPQFQQMQPSPMMPHNMPQGQQNLMQGMPGQPVMMQMNMQQRAGMQAKSNFSDDDNKTINQMAASIAQRTSSEDINKILESLTELQKQQMAERNRDPLTYYFRAQAAKEFLNRRKIAAQGQNPQNGGPQPQPQMAHNFGIQPSGSPFAASINQIHGQQADGMRSQEVGELVVPASNAQGISPEQFQIREAMLQNKQRQANGTPNSMLAQQQNQQNRQAQVQAQARAQAAARAAQLGLPGQGQQNPPQAKTPLSQVKRAGGVPGPQGLNRPPSRALLQPQQLQPVSQQQQPNQANPNNFAKFPTELQAILRQKPPTEWKATAQAYLVQQSSLAMGRTLSQQPGNMPMQANGQIQQLPNGSYLGGSTMQTSLSSGAMPTQTQLARTQPENGQQMLQQQQQQRQLRQNHDLARQRQIQVSQMQAQQRANQQQQLQLQPPPGNPPQPHPRPVGPPLTPQQMAYMDHQVAHVTIAQNLQSHEQWSPAIKTWGQLKQWLQRYPISTLPISRVEEAQRNQFQNLMSARHKLQQQEQTLLHHQEQQAAGHPAGQIGMQNQQLQQQLMQQGRLNMPQQLNPGTTNNLMNQVKPVTAEEIAGARRINQQFQDMPDARIAAIIHSQRVKAVQNRLNEQALRQEPVFMPVQTGQTQGQQPGTQMARQQSAPGNRPIPPQATVQRQQATKTPQGQPQPQPGAGQAPPKSLKRPSEVESSQASQSVQPGSRPQQQQAPGIISSSNISREQFEKLHPLQQQRFMALKRVEQRNREASQIIVQLTKEIQSGIQSRKGIANMSAVNKARATKLLTQDQTKNMLGRFDPFIIQFLSLSNDRDTTKHLLTLRMQLAPQYKHQSYVNKTYEVADQFSMTADQIETALTEMFQKYQMTLQKSTQIRQQSQGVPVQVQPITQPVTPGFSMQGQAPTQQLTPSNLERLEQEQQEVQRKNSKTSKGKDVPPAPTTSQAPYSFGDLRGQGTPKYAPGGLKQEDLKLDPKRRKRNPPTGAAPATPNVSTVGSKASPAIKAEQQNRKMEPELPFKCSIVNCEYQSRGFATQPELETHAMAAHRPTEEPVEDPIAFFIDNMLRGLGLDENGLPCPKKVDLAEPRSLPMQKTASAASIGIKAEVTNRPGVPSTHHPSMASARPVDTGSDLWSNAKVQPKLLLDVFSTPDPFATEFDLDEFVGAYKQSDQWKQLPRADPSAGFCADWKEPQELKEARERAREARLAKLTDGDARSPAAAEPDLLVNLKIDGLDIESDPDWEAIDDLAVNKDIEMDLGSPWENVSNAGTPSSPSKPVISADELLKASWDDLLDNSAGWVGWDAKQTDEDARSHASYESLDWEAMFADGDNVVPGSIGMQAKRTIAKKKVGKA